MAFAYSALAMVAWTGHVAAPGDHRQKLCGVDGRCPQSDPRVRSVAFVRFPSDWKEATTT